jgi:hypothetical protein
MKRSTQILLGLLAVLAIATFIVLRQPGEVSSSGSSGKVLVSYDSAAVDKMEIRSSVGSVVLEKEAAKWILTAPVKYRADDAAVTAAVGKGKALEISSLVSANPEKQKVFQVDSTGTLVKIYAGGAEKAVFRVGKPSSSYTETYVRQEGSNDVYLAAGILSSTFGRQVKEWRDKTIFKIDEDKIRSVKFQYGDTTFTLAFQDSLWHIGKDSVGQPTVKSFLTSLSNFQTDEFVDSLPSNLPKLMAGIEAEGTQIRFHYVKEGNKYYVQTSQSPQWFEVQNWKASQVLKRKKDFAPAKVS